MSVSLYQDQTGLSPRFAFSCTVKLKRFSQILGWSRLRYIRIIKNAFNMVIRHFEKFVQLFVNYLLSSSTTPYVC